jgi:hypothetical protein
MSGTLTFVDAALGLAVAAALAILTSIVLRRQREAHEQWVADATLTEGTVVSVRENGDAETMTEYTPVIVYAVDGQEFTIEGKPSHQRRFEVGARVTVAYKPRLPSSARVAAKDEITTYGRTIRLVMFVLVALVATIVSALVRS